MTTQTRRDLEALRDECLLIVDNHERNIRSAGTCFINDPDREHLDLRNYRVMTYQKAKALLAILGDTL